VKNGEDDTEVPIICARKYAWIIKALIPVLHRMQRQRKKIHGVTLRTRAGAEDLRETACIERAMWARAARKAGIR
jgi:hypothetical protein